MLKQIQLTQENMNLLLATWKEIFPNETIYNGFEGLDCFSYSLKEGNIGNHRYYLYEEDGEIVGLSGFYEEPFESPKESAWLGWFGVREKFRNKGYGRKIMAMFEEEARKSGYIYVRTYTEDSDKNEALAFYDKLGFTFEEYLGPKPPDMSEQVLVASKAVGLKQLVPWNSRPFYFD